MNNLGLKCDGKQHKCDVCEKLFNNCLVMVVHKWVYFAERPYKCVDCRDRFNCTSSLKTYYKLHKQQNLSTYDSDDFTDIFSSSQVHGEKKEVNRFLQFYTGKLLSFWTLIKFY